MKTHVKRIDIPEKAYLGLKEIKDKRHITYGNIITELIELYTNIETDGRT